MKIEIICSDNRHPKRPFLDRWATDQSPAHTVTIVNRPDQLTGGDILFAISCSDMIRRETRALFRHSLVVHASDLPRRRGWSPHPDLSAFFGRYDLQIGAGGGATWERCFVGAPTLAVAYADNHAPVLAPLTGFRQM